MTAVTALEALKGRLGYSELLAGVSRSDLWGVWSNVKEEEIERLAGDLVDGTSVFVNPNKHKWKVWTGGKEEPPLRSGGAWVLVWDSEETEGRRALAELRGASFSRKVDRVSRATLWRLSFAEPAKGKELSLAREMAVAARRDLGLLANPHMHRWACGEGAISLERALSYLDLSCRPGEDVDCT